MGLADWVSSLFDSGSQTAGADLMSGGGLSGDYGRFGDGSSSSGLDILNSLNGSDTGGGFLGSLFTPANILTATTGALGTWNGINTANTAANAQQIGVDQFNQRLQFDKDQAAQALGLAQGKLSLEKMLGLKEIAAADARARLAAKVQREHELQSAFSTLSGTALSGGQSEASSLEALGRNATAPLFARPRSI